MLPEGAHVKSAYLTPETGALATTSKAQKLFLDCSTIDAASSLVVGEAVEKSGIGHFSDTPVSVKASIYIAHTRVEQLVPQMELWHSCSVPQNLWSLKSLRSLP
jgi:3-hydroxyisobutyrate dehydrogenase-like beta-hydroxyacid dehydrogenase